MILPLVVLNESGSIFSEIGESFELLDESLMLSDRFSTEPYFSMFFIGDFFRERDFCSFISIKLSATID